MAASPIPQKWRSLLSLWLVIHFGLWTVSLSTIMSFHPAQDRMIELSTPYLTPLHLRADGRRLDLVRGNDGDWEHAIQWRAGEQASWRTITEPSSWLNGTSRLSRYCRAIGDTAMSEDTPTASILAMPLVQRIFGNLDASERSSMQIRVVALVPRELQEQFLEEAGGIPDAMIADGFSTIELWRAAVVEDHGQSRSGQPFVLVTLKEERLNALPQPDRNP